MKKESPLEKWSSKAVKTGQQLMRWQYPKAKKRKKE
jgi:hypothetical protein